MRRAGIARAAFSYLYSMTAYELKRGDIATITDIQVAGAAGERLYSLGFVRGAKIVALGWSLFRSSVLLGCGAVRLAVGRDIASAIEVKA